MQAHAWQLLALESEHIHYLQDSDGTPYVVLRECDRKLIRHRSAEHLYRTGDQAFRAQMRATMVSRKAHTWLIRDPALLATLRDRLCVGKRAPSAMLVAGPDMVQLLQHYKRHDVAKQLQTALAQLRPSADGCAPLGRADTRKRRRSLSSSSEPLNEEAKTSDSDEKGVSKTRSSEMSCIVMDKEEDKHHDTLKHSRVLGDHDDCPEPDRKKTRVAKEMRQLATWSVAPLTHNQRRRNKHKRGVKQHAGVYVCCLVQCNV